MIGTYTCKECGVTKAASSFYSSNRSLCISCLTKRVIEQRKSQKPKRYKVCSLCGRRIYMSAARYMRTEPRIICTSCQSTRKAKTTRGVNRIEAPCGRYMLPEKFGRCAEYMKCRYYGDCLRAVMLRIGRDGVAQKRRIAMLEKLFWMIMGAVVLVLLGIVGEFIESHRRLCEEEKILSEIEKEWR